MVIEMCQCSGGIPGVDRLPSHLHRDYVRVEILGEDHPNKGMIISFPLHDWNLNRDNRTIRFREVEVVKDELRFHVDWKQVARA